MSLEEIPSIYELEAAASAPRHICTEELPYISVEKCSGGHRQSIFEYLTGDTTRKSIEQPSPVLANKYSGRRVLPSTNTVPWRL